MGWFKNLVSTKAVDESTDWKMQSFSDEDFIEESLDDYKISDTSVLLRIAEDLIPNKFYNQVFIAGGFASHFAGITNEHGDIDIFCIDETAFDFIASSIKLCGKVTARFGDDRPVEVESRGYGRILKFQYEGINFDLVDSSPKPSFKVALDGPTSPPLKNIQDLLSLFDLNWTMTGIDLANRVVVCHAGAFSNAPQVNSDRFDICLEGTIDRVTKYRDRLVREPDVAAYETLLKKLKAQLKIQQKQDRKDAQANASWY